MPVQLPVNKKEVSPKRYTTDCSEYKELFAMLWKEMLILDFLLTLVGMYICYRMAQECCCTQKPIEVLPSLLRVEHGVMGLGESCVYPMTNMTVLGQELWEQSDTYAAMPEIFTITMTDPVEGSSY
jgi:hypothetical protein